MRCTLTLTVIIVINAIAASNLTITPADNGTNLLWLSWTDYEETGIVARYDGATFQNSRLFPDCPDGVSSTITEDPSGGMHLMFSKRDALLSLSASGAMLSEDSVCFDNYSEWRITGLLRRSTDPEFGLLGKYEVTFFSSGISHSWKTKEYIVSESGAITLGDSLAMEDPYPVSVVDYPNDLISMVYPVMMGSGNPVMATKNLVGGGPMPPTPSSMRIATFCHNTSASAVYLTADTLTWSTSESPHAQLITSGSCASTAVFLWSDSTETVQYSLHDCETGIVSTTPFAGEGPSSLQAAAMSANPEDPGMLLVWVDGTDILCRHYQNGWNNYAYIIAEDISGLYQDDISVCSTQDGYWVAYLTATDPEVFFVDRNNVTSIMDYFESVNPLRVTAFPNPFCEVLSISLEGADNPIHAILYDHTGRVAREETSADGALIWATRDLPVGNYLIRVTSGDQVFTEKAVLIR